MNLIDTNGVTHILKTKPSLRENYFLAPDVAEESEVALMVHGGQIPRKVHMLTAHHFFSHVPYLNHYNRILNQYGGRSFYNMTGFGDVSILAALHALVGAAQLQGQLFGTEPLFVFTDDGPLTRRIAREFPTGNVTVRPISSVV